MKMNNISDLAVTNDFIYFLDSNSLRRIDLFTSNFLYNTLFLAYFYSGTVTTIAGSNFVDTDYKNAKYNKISDIKVNTDGNLYITDSVVRKVDWCTGIYLKYWRNYYLYFILSILHILFI